MKGAFFMIIDSHVHIGEFGRFNMKPQYVVDSMKKYGINYALISSGACCEFTEDRKTLPDDWKITQYSGNMQAVEFARENDGKIGVLPWCKPSTEGFNDEFANLIEEGGNYIKGLKFHPYYSMMPMTALQIDPYLAFAAEREFPIMVHSADDQWSQPKFIYEAAKTHPNVNFIMAHVGLGSDNEEAIELIGSLPNLYGDTAWVKPESALKLVNKYGAHKLLFGTDNPIDGVDTYAHPFYKEYFGEFKNHVSRNDYELIMHENAERLFNLKLNKGDNMGMF